MALDLLHAIESSDPERAVTLFREETKRGRDPWDIHLSLFPVAQRVLNPPFFNAHFPKMYGIYRDLSRYLGKEDLVSLVLLEVHEFAKRPLLEALPRPSPASHPVPFDRIESAIAEKDREKTAALMLTIHAHEGAAQLARRLLLLGSGYLGKSLGHSFSCAAFVLLEMMERPDQDPWPCIETIADFFCQAQFTTTPELLTLEKTPCGCENDRLLKATSGRGIINLHHTITRFAMARTRPLFTEAEYFHLTQSWVSFMGEKSVGLLPADNGGQSGMDDYDRFYELFSEGNARAVVDSLIPMIPPAMGRQQLGRILIKAFCDRYQGNYDPHYLTGLGGALWAVAECWNEPVIVRQALLQHVDFYFENMRSKKPGETY